jgi:hypothetical protein
LEKNVYSGLMIVESSVVDPHHFLSHHFDADSDSTYNPDADPDYDFYLRRIRMRLRIRTQILAST